MARNLSLSHFLLCNLHTHRPYVSPLLMSSCQLAANPPAGHRSDPLRTRPTSLIQPAHLARLPLLLSASNTRLPTVPARPYAPRRRRRARDAFVCAGVAPPSRLPTPRHTMTTRSHHNDDPLHPLSSPTACPVPPPSHVAYDILPTTSAARRTSEATPPSQCYPRPAV
jgi:hypothetical protein